MRHIRLQLLASALALTFVVGCTKKSEEPAAPTGQAGAELNQAPPADSEPTEEAAPAREETACSLITEEEASAVLGPSKYRDGGSPDQCRLEPVTKDEGPSVTIDVVRENLENVFGTYGETGEKIAELGDAAAWRADLNGLAVRKGDVIYLITVLDRGGKVDPRAAATGIGQKLVD